MSTGSNTGSPLDTREPTRSEEDTAHPSPPGQQDSRQVLARVEVESVFAGPLPPPETLAAYNAIVPDAAERFLKMAEAQALHRQKLEATAIRSDARQAMLGLYFGLVVTLAMLAVAAYIAALGQTIGGAILGGAAVVQLAGVFVYGTRSRRRERIEKAKVMARTDSPSP